MTHFSRSRIFADFERFAKLLKTDSKFMTTRKVFKVIKKVFSKLQANYWGKLSSGTRLNLFVSPLTSLIITS